MVSQSNNPRIGNFRPVDEIDTADEFNAYAASGSVEPHYKLDKSGKTLECQGVIVDTIETVRTQQKRRNGRAILSAKEACRFLDDIAKTLVFGRIDRYLSKAYTQCNYCEDLQGLCLASRKHPKAVPYPFLQWFRLHED